MLASCIVIVVDRIAEIDLGSRHNHTIPLSSLNIGMVAWYVNLIIPRAGVNHRVAIECRDKSRPLDKDAVMAFRSKVSDIPGLQGLMVSAKGYQSGAKKFAEDNGVIALTMDELPGVGSLLAIRLENVTCPTKDNIGEPFWSIYEIDEDGEANGNPYGKYINGQRGALLFLSKKLCEEFLARETVVVQTHYRVFGLTQVNS